jgi:hypothetical protein
MPKLSRSSTIAVLVLTSCFTIAVFELWVAAQDNPGGQQQLPPAQRVVSKEDLEEQPADEEDAAPAAIEIDTSRDSPLVKTLYQATRETKEKAILANIAEAKKQVDANADMKFADAQGRTALHWAVFGSSYNTKTSILIAYEELADDMITRGIDINHEDMYNDTALDYLLYSPNFEMQTLLIEHGATSGFLAVFYHFFNEQGTDLPKTLPGAVAASRKADLTPGLTLSIRLANPVFSDRSRTGDPISGTVTYPLCKNGENISCKDGELLVPPGTRVNGTILFAQKAPDKYSRPRLVLDWSNILHTNGNISPLYARVLDVECARDCPQQRDSRHRSAPCFHQTNYCNDGPRRSESHCRVHHQRHSDHLRTIDPPRSSISRGHRSASAGGSTIDAEVQRSLGGMDAAAVRSATHQAGTDLAYAHHSHR